MSKKQSKPRKCGHEEPLLNSECLYCNPPASTKKPRKKKAVEPAVEKAIVPRSLQPLQFAGRNGGVMKMFDTEEEAFAFAEPNSTVAKYSTTDGLNFDFVGVVGIKTSADQIGRLLQQ